MKPSKRNLLRLFLATTAIFSLSKHLYISRGHNTIQFDDAYAFLRYAKNWIAGYGFAWNVADGPIYGCTSALYLYQVTLFRAISSKPDEVLLVSLSHWNGLFAVVVLTFSCFIVLPRDSAFRAAWVPLLVIPTVFESKVFLYHSQTGMDTTLSLLLNAVFAGVVFKFAKQVSFLRIVLCLITAWLAFNARPENIIYVSSLLPLLLVALGVPNRSKMILLWTSLILLVIVIDGILKAQLFNSFVPLPFYSKQFTLISGYAGATQWNAAEYLITFLRSCAPFLVCLFVFTDRLNYRPISAFLLPLLPTFIYFFTVVQIMGFSARFYFPFLPFVGVAAFVCLGLSNQGDPSGTRQRGLSVARILGLSILFLLIIPGAADRIASKVWFSSVKRIAPPAVSLIEPSSAKLLEVKELGWWKSILSVKRILDGAPEETVVAMSEHGYIGSSLLQIEIIDLVGLHDAQIAHFGFSTSYLISRNPDFIWMPHIHYTSINQAIVNSELFRDRYDYYPGAFDYGVAILRSSKHRKALHSAFIREFERAYPKSFQRI